MNSAYEMKIIGHIHSDFPTKFGIPRQSGLVEGLQAEIIFEPEYRVDDAFRGLEGYSHIWLIWQFSAALRDDWSPTVRPPRLGGNARMGVFATRSPFRPNSIGLSAVRLESIERHPKLGTVLHISGADLMDGTPIYDIKPYLPYTDSHPEATSGFAAQVYGHSLKVEFSDELLSKIPESRREGLKGVLEQDPRPGAHNDPERIYGVSFAGFDVRFSVSDSCLTVTDVIDDQTHDNSLTDDT